MIFVPNPPPTSGATTRTLCSGRPKMAANPLRMGIGPCVEIQHVNIPSWASQRGSTPIHDHLLAYDMGRAVENAIWITNGLNKMGRHISWHIVVYERSIFRGCNFEAADDGQWLIFYLDQVKRILSNVAAISYHHCHRFTDIMHSIASKRQLCARLREGSMRHKQRGWL